MTIPLRQPDMIDGAHYQGIPDMAKVKAQNFFGVIWKNTEGSTYRDPTFPTVWKAMRDHGIARRMAYHLPNNYPLQKEVDNFSFRQDACGGIINDEGIMLDCEQFPDRGIKPRPWDDIETMAQIFDRRYGVETVIYDGWGYGPLKTDRAWCYVDYRDPTHIGRWPNFRVPPVWWQYGGTFVDGITPGRQVDANVILDAARFNSCLHGGGPPVQPIQSKGDDVYGFVRKHGKNAVFLGNGCSRRWMPNPDAYARQLAFLRFQGVPEAQLVEHLVDTDDDMNLWGDLVGADPGDV